MDGQLMDNPALRRADIDALQLIFGRDAPLVQLGLLAMRLTQILHHLGAHVLVNLDDLQLVGSLPNCHGYKECPTRMELTISTDC